MNWLIAVVVALVLAAGVQTYRLKDAQAEHAQYREQIAGEALIAESAARQTEQRHQRAIDQVRTDAQAQKNADDALAADQHADNQRLQQQTTELLANRATLRANLAARGKTIEDLTDLLAQLRNEADQYAGELASALTASRRAGFACEAGYDAISERSTGSLSPIH